MPLRDHFHPPLENEASWEGFHGAWPTMIVIALGRTLPLGYAAEPRAHLGTDQYEYEVLICDTKHRRRLVAAVEIVSPANKDRPEHRRLFVAKCAALLRQQVCVAIVDLVTTRQFNLYSDLLDLIGHADLSPTDPHHPSAAMRSTIAG